MIIFLGMNISCKKEEKTSLTNQKVELAINQTTEKIINRTQKVKKIGEQPGKKVFSQRYIKSSKFAFGPELAKYSKTLSPRQKLHKDLKDKEIIRALEGVTKNFFLNQEKNRGVLIL
ncbi:MAG: hypothetical protein NZ530_04715 [Thermodesulfobacteriaceae bacterium]|nr:hypothetical protein [Thermodesulfobacteriaceae bacterium]MCX8042232.1 hypothetical protein [Thermodesulfobacteriaceae bacterium]MDW8136311.1 hypothetical protein [Thermodesulfobacterium sp.]